MYTFLWNTCELLIVIILSTKNDLVEIMTIKTHLLLQQAFPCESKHHKCTINYLKNEDHEWFPSDKYTNYGKFGVLGRKRYKSYKGVSHVEK